MHDYNNIRMNVPKSTHVLLSQLVMWLESVTYHHKQTAFESIKRKLLKEDLRRLDKGAFVSNSTADNYNSINNSFCLYEFKPIEQNYTSVKIMDYETHGMKKDLRESLARRIQINPVQLHNKNSFLEGWMTKTLTEVLLPENFPLSDYAIKKISSYHSEALDTIRRFAFSHYCKQHIRSKTSRFGVEPLHYKSTPLSRSLTYLQGHFNQIALDAFEILLRAGGQQQSEHTYLYEIGKLVELAQLTQDAIRQEIFLQVIKQTSSGKMIYTRILCCLCYCVKIPTRLYAPLLNYLYQEVVISQRTPKELLNYAFYHAIKNFDKERKYPPCLFELYCAFNTIKVPIIINFPKQKAFFVESYSTVEELMTELIEFYNLDPSIEYLLEVNGFLMEKGILLQNLSRCCQLQEEDSKWKEYVRFRGLMALIVLKNTEDASRSPDCQNIMYNYSINQYLRGFYPVTNSQIIKIAALKMHCELDDEQNYNFQYESLITRRRLWNLSKIQRLSYRKHILKQYYQLFHLDKIEARKQILTILSKSRGYATHFFKCQVEEQDFQGSIIWVGVQKQRFMLVQAKSGRMMRTIPFNRISQWGKCSTELCVRVDSIGQVHMQTPQVEALTSVFQAYINYHVQLLTIY